MTKRPFVVHVVSHLRWPREGAKAFQRARIDLVEWLDRLAASKPSACLLLDGQVILLDDYLEVRPEQEGVLAELARSGRLSIGPWYVTTDSFLVSPEALVRNLLLGAQTSARFGPRLDVAYMPESAGHIGQMPQILRGFGIGSAVAARGVGDLPAEVWWESPDGSRVLLINLRDGPVNGALPRDAKALKQVLGEARDSLRGHTASGAALVFDSEAHSRLPELAPVLETISRGRRGIRAVHDSLLDYIADVLATSTDLPLVVGELRSPQRVPLLAGTLSSQMWIKQANHAAQTLLERAAEPFGAWASLVWSATEDKISDSLADQVLLPAAQHELLAHAWRLLLQNHAYDTIRGNIADPVQREIALRYDQASQIAEELAHRSMRYLAGQIDTSGVAGNGAVQSVTVFNSAGIPQTDVVEIEVLPTAGATTFEVVSDDGTIHLCETETGTASHSEGGLPGPAPVIIRFVAEDVPPFGYRTYALRTSQGGNEQAQKVEDGQPTIENEWLSVSVDPSAGTFDLFDKQTGRSFAALNRFSDGGDRGDVLSYCPPERDTVIDVPTNTPLDIQRHVGPVTQVLEMLQILRVPQSLTPERTARLPLAAQFVPIPITIVLRVTRGVPRVDVDVSLLNGAHDHRLRVHFPTGIITDEAFFDGHFEVIRRSISLPGEGQTAGWAEQPVHEQPQRGFVTVLGDETGLTVASRGLPEVAVLAHPHYGTEIALTLLRSVGWLRRHDLARRHETEMPIEAPGAQCPGDYTFHYSIIPHGADPLPAWHAAWAYQTPLHALVTGIHRGTLPPVAGLVAADNPAFVLSAVITAADGAGLIVRGYNISEEPVSVTLTLGVPAGAADLTRLDETPTGERVKPARDGTFCFEAGPHQIVTLRFATD